MRSLVRVFKCHILAFLEGATSAIYHASPSVLGAIDAIQQTFLDELGLSHKDALLNFNLAPLGLRRDIAMLGILYKVAWNCAPKPIQGLFSLHPATLERHGFISQASQRHSKQIFDPVAFNHPVIIKRSIFGLISVFNKLPQATVDAKTVKLFQKQLQNFAKNEARNENARWPLVFHVDC